MRTIAEELMDRNHSVTVLIRAASPTMERFKFMSFEINMEQQEAVCNELAGNRELVTSLKELHFDVLLYDPVMPCAGLMSKALELPSVMSLRGSFASSFERLCGQMPAPPSYEMEDFVQSSGDDGIVVFSLGSMVKNLTKERANTIASALGQIPQKVVWGYKGKKPETLAPNTRIYEWIPQNDLLGHPKTKAFITHGGTNGIYEAIYHGVPMVGMPLFSDQPDNINHMKTKGTAVMVDFNKMETKDLKQAISDVINNPSYKESMMRLSRIHHDQPMKPLDQAVYWIEFVMRNKGAKHLRVEAHNLTWYQYHCLDVAAFLFSIIALAVFIFVKTCSWLFRKCFRKTPTKSKKE
ncbi:hypothetical protein PGIGA_G00166590 [Pangasianodon gigas]|uniref:Uncharacterized protein n=1 Tax=Pangasianodon gigas TaxID=30993 RepID=A0ACC5XT45_PANGG|nr:hypothetical protein [Pangasianodon gigas]